MNAIPADFHPTATTDLALLLAVIADPATHEKRLNELIAQEKATHAKIAEHTELMAKTRGMHTAAEAAMIVATNRKNALDAREAELNARSQALDSAELLRSDAGLRQRETALTTREAAVTRRENTISEREAAYEKKVALFKKLHQEASL